MSKIGYLDCFSGISGDMLLGALVDAGLSLDELCAELRKLKLVGYRIEDAKAQRAGLAATRVTVALEEASQPQECADVKAAAFTEDSHGDPVVFDDGRIRTGAVECHHMNVEFVARQPSGEQRELFLGTRAVERRNQERQSNHVASLRRAIHWARSRAAVMRDRICASVVE